jgi:hypothetical protein
VTAAVGRGETAGSVPTRLIRCAKGGRAAEIWLKGYNHLHAGEGRSF